MTAGSAAAYCRRLGLSPPTARRRLTTGRSGAAVWEVSIDGRPLVLKVTTAGERLSRAGREVELMTTGRGRADALMPQVVAAGRGHGWVAVAMERCVPLPPAVQVPDEIWLSLADTLGALHGPVGDRAGDPADTPAPPVTAALPIADPPEVRSRPRAVGDGRLMPWIELVAADDLRAALDRLDRPAPFTLPAVIVHGDCHSENVVVDEGGRLLLIEWQEVHAGDGLADLVFVWQRAEFAGARPPRAAMSGAYADRRALASGALQPLLDRAELRSLIEDWPPFLRHGDGAARLRMAARLTALVGRWSARPPR